jgi:hypothetical protein
MKIPPVITTPKKLRRIHVLLAYAIRFGDIFMIGYAQEVSLQKTYFQGDNLTGGRKSLGDK